MLWLNERSVFELSDQEGQQSESLLKDCEKLKMVCDSFKDFSVWVIQILPSVEIMELGYVERLKYAFCFANLEVRGGRREEN